MDIKEELGRSIAERMNRIYDDEEGNDARTLAEWLLSHYDIKPKKTKAACKPRKIKQCPDSKLWFKCCRNCHEWYDMYQDKSESADVDCYCLNHADYDTTRSMWLDNGFKTREDDCPYKNVW